LQRVLIVVLIYKELISARVAKDAERRNLIGPIVVQSFTADFLSDNSRLNWANRK